MKSASKKRSPTIVNLTVKRRYLTERARALQHYLGHKNIQHTVRYTEMAPDRFKEFCLGPGHLGAAASGRRQARDHFRFPLNPLAFAPASRLANCSLMNSIDLSICSSVMALMPPECSTWSSRGTRSAQIFI